MVKLLWPEIDCNVLRLMPFSLPELSALCLNPCELNLVILAFNVASSNAYINALVDIGLSKPNLPGNI